MPSSAAGRAVHLLLWGLCCLSGVAAPDESPLLVRSRRVPYHHLHHKGYFFPISSYVIKKHRPGGHGWKKKPEVWEYKGQYMYGFKKHHKDYKKFSAVGPLALGALAAGLPLLLTPLLGLLMSVPVLVPTVVTASGLGRRRRSPRPVDAIRMREVQIVSDYLEEVHYDENRHQRLLADYLQCQGLLDNQCLEQLACVCSHPRHSAISKLEKTVSAMLVAL